MVSAIYSEEKIIPFRTPWAYLTQEPIPPWLLISLWPKSNMTHSLSERFIWVGWDDKSKNAPWASSDRIRTLTHLPHGIIYKQNSWSQLRFFIMHRKFLFKTLQNYSCLLQIMKSILLVGKEKGELATSKQIYFLHSRWGKLQYLLGRATSIP